MKLRLLALSFTLLLALALQAQAHFVWVAAVNGSAGQPEVHVWFSELAEPDSAELLDKITAVKVWSRSLQAKPEFLKVTKRVEGTGGALIGSLTSATSALSAHINYGVLDRGDQKFLLQYHAKYLDGAAPAFKALARDEQLQFDIVPQQTAKGYTFDVLFAGRPAAASTVVILDPSGTQIDATTDEAGRFSIENTKPGLYSIRAKWVVKESGKLGDQDYPQVNHYSTLALRVPMN